MVRTLTGWFAGGVLVASAMLSFQRAQAQEEAAGEPPSAQDLIGEWVGPTELGELTASIRTGRLKPEYAVADLFLESRSKECSGSATVFGKIDSIPIYAESYDPSDPSANTCKVAMKLHLANTLLVSEIDGCTEYRGPRCEFSGILIRQNASVSPKAVAAPVAADQVPDLDGYDLQEPNEPVVAASEPDPETSATETADQEASANEPGPDQAEIVEPPERDKEAIVAESQPGRSGIVADIEPDQGAIAPEAEPDRFAVVAESEPGQAVNVAETDPAKAGAAAEAEPDRAAIVAAADAGQTANVSEPPPDQHRDLVDTGLGRPVVVEIEPGQAVVLAQAEADSGSEALPDPIAVEQVTQRRASDADACENLLGRNVKPISFDQAVALYRSVDPKDEFETSEQYLARLFSDSPTRFAEIIRKPVEDRSHFQYDADRQRMLIGRGAFIDVGMDHESALVSAGAYRLLNGTPETSINIVIEKEYRQVGDYMKLRSSKNLEKTLDMDWVTSAILEPKNSFSVEMFPGAPAGAYIMGEVSLPPSEARRLKPALGVAFIVVPKAPFLIEGQHKLGRATAQNPVNITEIFSILIADIRCALLLDGENRVLGAYPTG